MEKRQRAKMKRIMSNNYEEEDEAEKQKQATEASVRGGMIKPKKAMTMQVMKTGDQDTMNSEKNKELFIDKYGIKFQIPSLKVQKALIYNKDPQYCLQVVNYIVPMGDDYFVETHYIDPSRQSERSSFQELFSDRINGFGLRLLKMNEDLTKVERVEEHFIREELPGRGKSATKIEISFSSDGRYLAVFFRQLAKFKIFEIQENDLIRLFQDIKEDNPIIKFALQSKNPNEITAIEFDDQSKHLILSGPMKIYIYSMEQLASSTEAI